MKLQYILDARKLQGKRMFFMNDEGKSRHHVTVTIPKEREFKEIFTVYVSPEIIDIDKLTSLDVQVHYSLINSTGDSSSGVLRPVIAQFEKMTSDSIYIKKQ